MVAYHELSPEMRRAKFQSKCYEILQMIQRQIFTSSDRTQNFCVGTLCVYRFIEILKCGNPKIVHFTFKRRSRLCFGKQHLLD